MKWGTIFKFVNGKVCHSIEWITIPAVIAVQNVFLTTKIIENDISVLLSKDTVRKANTYIDFINDKIILNKETLVKLTTSGHYYISISKIVDDNHDEVLKSGSTWFCDDVNELSMKKRKKLQSNYIVNLVTLLVISLLRYY